MTDPHAPPQSQKYSTRVCRISGGVLFRTLCAFILLGAARSDGSMIQWTVADGGNDHYYELVDEGPPFTAITWDEAKLEAEARFHMGFQGVLASITSQAESDFVSSFAPGFAWIGGYQPIGSAEPDGGWRWLTGEAWSFTNWDVGEPNNFYFGDVGGPPFGSPEDALHLRPVGVWNDLPHDAFLPAYLVEYGPAISAVPEPSTMTMSLLGCVIGLVLRSRRLGFGA